MINQDNAPAYTPSEEFFNSLIHGIGVLLSMVMLFILVWFAAINSCPAVTVVTSAIFGISMITVFSTSTLYHYVKKPDVKMKIKRVDHIAIYYLIAGTYTPFCLVSLGGVRGWIIFCVIWALAVVGTVLKIVIATTKGTKFWSLGLYLLMGWMVLFSLPSFVSCLPSRGLVFLFLGGLCYTVGIVFYVMKKVRYTHAIWHLFVLGGAIMHFFAILYSCVLF
jgi:hemolysin III